VLHP